MGAFQYDNPLMAAMVKIANMMIVSFFWLVTCLPIITIIPASAALFHTTAKVIRGNGSGVIGDFFSSFRASLKKGLLLSLGCLVTGAMLYFAMSYGWQMQKESMLGTVYFLIGCFITLAWVSTVLYLPAALSRFEGGLSMYLRMGMYFAGKNILLTLLRLVLLVAVILLVDFYPIALLLLPGLYTDLVCGGIEKLMTKFMEDNGLSQPAEPDVPDEEEIVVGSSAMPSLEMASLYDESKEDAADE